MSFLAEAAEECGDGGSGVEPFGHLAVASGGVINKAVTVALVCDRASRGLESQSGAKKVLRFEQKGLGCQQL